MQEHSSQLSVLEFGLPEKIYSLRQPNKKKVSFSKRYVTDEFNYANCLEAKFHHRTKAPKYTFMF